MGWTCGRRRSLGTLGMAWGWSWGAWLAGWELLVVFGDLEVALGQFLYVHVLERHHADVLHETGGAVHVPHPGILHRDFEEDLAVLRRADVQLDLVGEVEAALGLDHMAEQPHHVAVLAVELKLHLGLVLL